MSVTGSLDELRGLPEQDIATFLNSVDSEYLIENNERGELARWGWGVNAANIELTPDQREKIQHAYINYNMRPVTPRTGRRSARVVPMGRGLTKKKSKKRSKTSKRRNKGNKKSVKKSKKTVRKTKKQPSKLGGEGDDDLYYTQSDFHRNLNELIDECIDAVDKVKRELDPASESYDEDSAFYESVAEYLVDLMMDYHGDDKMRILFNLLDNANKSSEDPIKAEIIKVIKGQGPYKPDDGEEPILDFFKEIKHNAEISNLFEVKSRRGRGKKKSVKKSAKKRKH